MKEVIGSLRRLGYELSAEGDRLRYRCHAAVPPPEARALLARLKEGKAEALAVLRREVDATTKTSHDQVRPHRPDLNPFEILRRVCSFTEIRPIERREEDRLAVPPESGEAPAEGESNGGHGPSTAASAGPVSFCGNEYTSPEIARKAAIRSLLMAQLPAAMALGRREQRARRPHAREGDLTLRARDAELSQQLDLD